MPTQTAVIPGGNSVEPSVSLPNRSKATMQILKPETSIIICTRNRAGTLRNLLASLLKLDSDQPQSLEIVLVDNGSTDETRKLVLDFKRRAQFSVTYVFEGRRGVSAAKNAGIAASQGKVLLFTDDDCIVPPNWLTQARASFDAKDSHCIVGGRVERYNPTDAPVTIKTSLEPEILRGCTALPGFLHGCNLAIGRDVFESVGLFDVRFGPGTRLRASEESDLIYRALKQDIPVRYDPNFFVFHNHGRSRPSEVRRIRNAYSVANGALAAKYLLAGEVDLAKVSYWSVRSQVRDWRKGRVNRRDVISDVANLLRGAALYLFLGLGRSPR